MVVLFLVAFADVIGSHYNLRGRFERLLAVLRRTRTAPEAELTTS
jgi:hypothetical protein